MSTKPSRLELAQDEYFEAFGMLPPYPFGPSDDVIAAVLEGAVKTKAPVPIEFDWWAYVPPGGAA